MSHLLRCALVFVLAQSAAPTRDGSTPASSTGTASIAGTVVAADASRAPIRRATLTLTRSNARDVRYADTDERGQYVFRDLPAGHYLLSASKGAYVSFNYGESRPGVAPTPIPLAANQAFVANPIALVRGAVIAGRLVTPRGQPVAGVMVEATQFYVINGERRRRSTPSTQGGALTDAHGEFRIFGLSSGDYLLFVGSMLGISSIESREVTADELKWADERAQGRTPAGPAAPAPPAGRAFSYAPSFFPGTTDEDRATVSSLKPGDERTGLTFNLPLLRVSVIAGTVVGPDGAPAANVVVGRVSKVTGLLAGFNTSVRTGAEGRFSLNNVAPGDYLISGRASATGSVPTMWATTEMTVRGEDVNNVELRLRPGARMTGRVQFEGTGTQDPRRVSIRLTTYVGNQSLTQATIAVNADGSFSTAGIGPGTYRLSASYVEGGPETRWRAVSAIVGDQNALDRAIEIRLEQDVAPVVITFTDRESRLNGVLADRAGTPVPLFVLVFPVDRNNWFSQSRWIRFTRADVNGAFDLRGLPAGDYYLCALTELEVNQQNEPAFLEEIVAGAIKITLADGEAKTQHLRIGGGQ